MIRHRAVRVWVFVAATIITGFGIARAQAPASEQVIGQINFQLSFAAKKVLGQAFRSAEIKPEDKAKPDSWVMKIEYVDASPAGDPAPLFAMIGVGKPIMDENPVVKLKSVEVRVQGTDAANRCVVAVPYPKDSGILDLFWNMQNFEKFTPKQQGDLGAWVAEWRVEKYDPKYTCIDFLSEDPEEQAGEAAAEEPAKKAQ
jgi:hypothetical protein